MLPMQRSLRSFISDAFFASLSARHRIPQKQVDFKQNSALTMMVTDVTETLLCLKALSLFRLNGDQSLPFRRCHRHWSKFEVFIIGSLVVEG